MDLVNTSGTIGRHVFIQPSKTRFPRF